MANININLLEQGKNTKQIKHYIELFKPNNVMIVSFNEIVSDQNKLALRLATFLDIDPFEIKPDIHENVSEIPKNKLIKFIHNDFILTKYLKRVVPKSRLRSKIGKFIMKNFYTKEQMGDKERFFLNDYYAQEIQELKELGINV